MGPPPFSGGNGLGSADAALRRHHASMGPPPFSGGNNVRLSTIESVKPRFNGAAAFQRRKSPCVDPQPRTRPDGWLQWGRRLSAAEMRGDAAVQSHLVAASMGPPPFSGGN